MRIYLLATRQAHEELCETRQVQFGSLSSAVNGNLFTVSVMQFARPDRDGVSSSGACQSQIEREVEVILFPTETGVSAL